MISIGYINSETGIRQPVEEIAKILKDYKWLYFHTDITQAIGKVDVDLKNVDLASFSAHKIFGFKGIGGLVKKNNVNIVPLIHGGKSTTVFRSGTPATELIVSLAKALRLALIDLDKKYDYVKMINNKIKEVLEKYENVYINSTSKSIPQILNLSVVGVKPEVMLHALEDKDIYISTQSACSVSSISKAVLSLTKDEKRAKSSIRISLSYKTTEKEVEIFLKSFDECYKKLMELSHENN